ncbi:MAG TPA: quinone oxidoreductase [Spirochaetia bacterium]|nr:quinone oxidoreductase [Spirochaetia bacterium]
MKAIQILKNGGPEVLELRELPRPAPAEGEVLVRLRAIGVNFIDTYQRTGLYPVKLPYVPGMEGSGTVEQVGTGVSALKAGDRIAYTNIPGAYAEYSVIPAGRAVILPDNLDFRQGAAAMLQGMTAHYLATSTFPLKKGDVCLIHAAAGGVGLLLVQIARMRGARILATVSTKEKAVLAREAGADHVILYTEKNFEDEVKSLTEGRGVDVVYDSVGKTTFEKGLNCLRPLGTMVVFGQSSGKMEPIDPAVLGAKGSLFLTRPILGHYIADRKSLLFRSGDILGWAAAGQLKLSIGQTCALSEAAEAHRNLEGRKTTGKVLLIP